MRRHHHHCGNKTRQTLAACLFILLGSLPGVTVGSEVAAASPQRFDGKIPQLDGQVRVGVGSCAEEQCHGASKPWQVSQVLQNEHATWVRFSYHFRSFEVLGNEVGRRIGQRLGIDPQKSPECLACHTDYVPEAQRQRQFRVEDGVGCEACHGGAKAWLAKHVSMSGKRPDYIAAGLYPTDNAEARAKLCLSCHMGTDHKFVDHRLIAAGHPRLVFDLDTFMFNMPIHHRVDRDYEMRKLNLNHAEVWALGQIVAVQRSMQLIANPAHRVEGSMPEPVFLDCYGCHREVPAGGSRGGSSGAPRLNDGHISMVELISSAGRIEAAGKTVAAAFVRGDASVANAATQLSDLAEGLRSGAFHIDGAGARKILDRLLQRGAADRFVTYLGAEQATMAVASLLRTIDTGNVLAPEVDAVFQSLEDAEKFSATEFKRVLVRLQQALTNKSAELKPER